MAAGAWAEVLGTFACSDGGRVRARVEGSDGINLMWEVTWPLAGCPAPGDVVRVDPCFASAQWRRSRAARRGLIGRVVIASLSGCDWDASPHGDDGYRTSLDWRSGPPGSSGGSHPAICIQRETDSDSEGEGDDADFAEEWVPAAAAEVVSPLLHPQQWPPSLRDAVPPAMVSREERRELLFEECNRRGGVEWLGTHSFPMHLLAEAMGLGNYQ